MVGINRLSDKAIKAALKTAASTGKPLRVSDGDGMLLEARPSGVGWWRLRFRNAGKEGMVSLGTYPAVSLADARSRRQEARRTHASGVDPGQQRKAVKARQSALAKATQLATHGMPQPGTFEYIARQWLTTVHEHKVSEGHAERTRLRLEQMVFPDLGSRPVNDIDAPELLAVLRKIEARGALETTHRTKDACGQVFRFGIASGVCQRNPAADLRDALRPVPTRHFAAIIDPTQAGGLLRAIDSYTGSPVTVAALKLSALLLLRPGELRHLEWAWVDLPTGTITLPPEIMKRRKAEKANGIPHLVPLAPQAIEVIKQLAPLTGHRKHLFPSVASPTRCMSENTVRTALRRMGYSNDEMTAHGFRAMARTMAAERIGIAPEVIEAQLAHTVPDALGRSYNRTQYLAQRRELMTKWADFVDQLRIETPNQGNGARAA
jgi:hypothetical protein